MAIRAPLSALLLVLALAGCRDPDAPRPVAELPPPPPESVPLRPLSSRDDGATDARPVATARPEAAARPVTPAPQLPPGVPDPAEPGITHLARLARYVFREIRAGERTCSFANPLHDDISFAFHIEVMGGRMTTVHLAWVGTRVGQEIRPLPAAPPELVAYAECLRPLLEAVQMDPAPADGVYQPEYSYPGHPAGR
jgi:hypothetical protein